MERIQHYLESCHPLVTATRENVPCCTIIIGYKSGDYFLGNNLGSPRIEK